MAPATAVTKATRRVRVETGVDLFMHLLLARKM
jgi:hypothetical protein